MNIYEQQARNRRMTWVMMLVFVLFFALMGLGLDYFYLNFSPVKTAPGNMGLAEYKGAAEARHHIPFATIAAFLAGLGMAANGMWNGRSMVLRSAMARRADPASEKEQRYLNVVAEMSLAAGINPPAAYVLPDNDLNAFATGFDPSDSAVAVTEGLLNTLNREELQAVVAHELSHVKNYDIRLMTIAAALIGAICLISDFAGRSARFRTSGSHSSGGRISGGRNKGGGILIVYLIWLLFVLLAPILSRLLAMAISRQREYLADASGADLTRNPLALAAALEKIRGAISPTAGINNGVAHMCIADPRGGLIEEKQGLVADLLATHPPIEKRILALKVMAYQNSKPAVI